MVMAAELSGLGADETERLRDLIGRAGLPTAPPALGAPQFLKAMSRDKKVQKKALRFVLLQRLGAAFVTGEYNEADLYNICDARSSHS